MCAESCDDPEGFLQTAVDYFEAQPNVARYAAFGMLDSASFFDGTKLSRLGQVYAA